MFSLQRVTAQAETVIRNIKANTTFERRGVTTLDVSAALRRQKCRNFAECGWNHGEYFTLRPCFQGWSFFIFNIM